MRAQSQDDFDAILGELRPKLHRYCARMTGSVVDGEDVVQDALMKAVQAFDSAEPILDLENWMFRIAHNTALDFLRRRARQNALLSDGDPDMFADDDAAIDRRIAAAANLQTFMRLPAAQRSCVVLMDVLGYSLQEISGILTFTIPAVKAALHRGRARLREFQLERHEIASPILSDTDRLLLSDYVDRFNAHDFDAVREMLAEEVRLELVARTRMKGKAEVGRYFQNYGHSHDWHCTSGLVEARPAVFVHRRGDGSSGPMYFVLLEWSKGALVSIRDFRYAQYAMEGAELTTFG